MHLLYIIEKDLAVPAASVLEWGEWMQAHQEEYHLFDTIGPLWVSTVFLGVALGMDPGNPLLWETAEFNDDEQSGLGQWRFSFKEEAYRFHKTKVAKRREQFDATTVNLDGVMR